jgi:putative AlgH/UPF0301 family transcriptional regulator
MDSGIIKSISPGYFIASTQHLLHQDFSKSVILITNWDGKHYSGIKINHILPARSGQKVQTYNGGNIAKKVANLLHSPDITWSKTKKITENICMTNIEKNDIDLEHDKLPKESIVVYGFTTWSKNRLEEEIKGNWWIPINGNEDLLFSVPVVNRWYYAYNTTSTTPDCVSIDIARS